MELTVRKSVALAVGVLLTTTALSVVAGSPADAATKPTVSWRFSDATVSAKAKTTVVWTVKHSALRGDVVLQRTRGTSGRYVNVVALAKRTGSGTTSGKTRITAPGQGRYSYRIVVHNSAGKAVTISKPTRLYSYAAVKLETLYDTDTDTVQIGGKLFRYAVYTYHSDYSFDSTTCRSARIVAGMRDGDNGSATIQFVEENGDGGSLNIPGQGVVYAKTFSIARGALSINGDTTDAPVYYNGVFSCWTPSGQ